MESLRWWDFLKSKSLPPISRFSSIVFQPWFPPGYDSQYKAWAKHNITQLIDLTSNNRILDKGELEEKVNDKISWYMYFQIRHMFDSIHFTDILKCPLTDLETILYKLKGSLQKATSMFCKFFGKMDCHSIFSYQRFWSRIGGISTDSAMWDTIWKSTALLS